MGSTKKEREREKIHTCLPLVAISKLIANALHGMHALQFGEEHLKFRGISQEFVNVGLTRREKGMQ
jgi:hypothetical protein